MVVGSRGEGGARGAVSFGGVTSTG
jgi:hypothetical protein